MGATGPGSSRRVTDKRVTDKRVTDEHSTGRRPAVPARPSREELAAARDRIVPDLVRPGVPLLLCGINPGLWSAWAGLHFARPGNRLWRVLAASGLTPRLLGPDETTALLEAGIGVTNLAPRATARADELSAAELSAGVRALERLCARVRPRIVAVLGVSAYRTAFGRRDARVGEQPRGLGGARLWVLPNPSGLNARYQLPEMTRLYAQVHDALTSRPPPGPDLSVASSPSGP